MIIMAEYLKRHFLHLLNMVDGLHAIVITDRDGVPVLKVVANTYMAHISQCIASKSLVHHKLTVSQDHPVKVSDEHAPELAVKPRFLATAAMTMEQSSKLGVSTNKSIVSMYMNHQVVSLNKPPLIVNMIASADANTGLILSLESDMQEALDDIRTAVEGS